MVSRARAAAAAAIVVLAGCASHPPRRAPAPDAAPTASARGGGYYQDDGPPGRTDIDLASIPKAVPRKIKRSKYGNPKRYTALGKTYYVLKSAQGFTQTGMASWYGRQFHGERTSSGEPYSMFRMTAAHKRLPIPCYVRVTNLDNDKQVIVKVNDRGPFKKGRIIDLSYVAARRLGIVAQGSAPVRIQTVTPASMAATAVAATSDDDSAAPRPPLARAPAAAAVDADGVTPAGASRYAGDLARARSDADGSMPSSAPRRAAAPGASAETHPDPSSAALFLQTGAFGEPDNAHRLRRRLHRAGVTDVTILRPSARTPLYRVRVGPFADRARMTNTRRRLADRGFAVRVVER